MKLAILGDSHFGKRGDNIAFHEYDRKFYENVFFPYLEKNKIHTVIQTGDLFDRRKFINFNSLYLAREYFFSKFAVPWFNGMEKKRLIVYVGNHDIYFRNTLKVNSPNLLVSNYAYVVDHPQTLDFGTMTLDLIPWVCESNEEEVKKFIEETESKVCFGHFEIKGFEMDKGNISLEGIERESLSKYKMVITGHFHHRSSDGHIFYVGSPGESTWADYGDRKGFHIFDTNTLELEFIENPYCMFHKVMYNDDLNSVSCFHVQTFESIQATDFSVLANSMVKVVVIKKDNPILFDLFMDAIYKVQPLNVSIVEDFTDYGEVIEEDSINQADSTTDILDKYVDSIDVGLDKDRMKNILRVTYNEALEQQNDIL